MNIIHKIVVPIEIINFFVRSVEKNLVQESGSQDRIGESLESFENPDPCRACPDKIRHLDYRSSFSLTIIS